MKTLHGPRWKLCIGAWSLCQVCTAAQKGRFFFHFSGTQHSFFPTSLWGFCFLPCIPPVARPVRRVRVRVPSANNNYYTDLTPLISQLLISHNSSHTQLISHTTHLTQLISHNSSHTQFISHNSSHTPLISHNSSHTTHLTHNSSHTQLISHTTHLNSSHTTHLTHLISQTCCLAGAVHRAS